MAQPKWKCKSPCVNLGLLPSFLDDDNQKSATEQLGDGYAFAGGWKNQKGFTLTNSNCLLYTGDPPMRPIAECNLRDETICLYESSFVAVIKADRSFEVCRMD